ncbi:MAG: hypothetical protein ACR2GB_00125 [Nocardioidaceae bacterium]
MASPAHAQRLAVTDDAGDTFDRGLDMTRVTFSNRDRAVASKLRFARERPGDVILLVSARHGSAVVIVSEHRRRGLDNTYIVGRDGASACGGLTSDWDRKAARMQVRMPARCLQAGNYGAICGWTLTEGLHGVSDVDYAPEKRNGDIRLTSMDSSRLTNRNACSGLRR